MLAGNVSYPQSGPSPRWREIVDRNGAVAMFERDRGKPDIRGAPAATIGDIPGHASLSTTDLSLSSAPMGGAKAVLEMLIHRTTPWFICAASNCCHAMARSSAMRRP